MRTVEVTYSCVACPWEGDRPSTTHTKEVREGEGGLETVHTHINLCPKCFNPVRSKLK
jgi:hypothetical protein